MHTGGNDISETPRLLDRVRDKIRVRHYSIRTEQAYLDWIKRFIWFHGKHRPSALGAPEGRMSAIERESLRLVLAAPIGRGDYVRMSVRVAAVVGLNVSGNSSRPPA